MKRYLLAALIAVMVSGMAYTQETPEHKNLFGAKVLFIGYGIPNDDDNLKITNGLELSYVRNLGKSLNVAVPLKVGLAHVPGEINNRTFGSLDAMLQLKAPGKTIIPYLTAGAGVMAAQSDDVHLQIPVGGGVNFRVGSNSFVNLQGEYRIATLDQRNHLQAGLGVLFRLGRMADADGDGITDAMDACPNDPGPEATKGCPDKDGDGIADKMDRCPDLKGAPEMQGCPDSDGDGFIDPEDECPQTAGQIKGCPDTDGDGLTDNKDKCPTEAGPESNMGCPIPDRDNDGTPDADDRCPDVAGLAHLQGCPDRDGDGVSDIDDRCPDKPGPYSGCPDTDGDGIMDADDRCPMEVGPASNRGCPEIKEETKKVLTTAMRAVQFETAKAVLKKESYPILDQVVMVLREYPSYHLRISGHTDNVGMADNNQRLSEERAQACYQYLISKDIDSRRLSHAGFGAAKPIADNKTESGRRVNRRVEFELYLP